MLNVGPKRAPAYICAHCGQRRAGMKQYKNPFTGKMDRFHALCYKGLVAKYNYQEARKEVDEIKERVEASDECNP